MANILFQWLVIAYAGMIHPFFVSMTDMSYNEQEQSLEISIRIFTDDLENTLRKYHQEKIDILHPVNRERMNSYVDDYLQKHLKFTINDKPVQMKFVGYEEQSESIWSYFEIDNVRAVNKVAVVNSLLHDLNASQINMMHIKVREKEQSNKLNYPDTAALFNF